LKVGDQVLLKNETGHTKLDFKYSRPYTVDRIQENDNKQI